MRILIVDDREESRYLLTTLLKGHGFAVESAGNGAEALEKARFSSPQLIISDLLMPVMDGYTLLRQWRADETLKQIPFVVYTATYTDPQDEQLALSLGASAFILKPAEPAEFLARVQQVMASPAAPNPPAPPAPRPEPATHIPVSSPEEEEKRYLRQYSEVLVHKLEDKIEALDRTNRELEQQLARSRLLEQEYSRLATAVEQAADAIMVTDTAGTILYVNPAFETISGYSRQEAVGSNPRILKSSRHAADFYQQMWTSIARGGVWSGRITNRRKSGEFYEQEMTISTIRDASGKVLNYVAVQHDVTQKVALETQLRQAQKMEAIGQLAGGVAHDFNNILTIIHGNASLLANGLLEPADQADCLEQILRATERATGLTRQLLMFSRKQVMQPDAVDLNEIVEGMVKMLRRILGEDISLHSELGPGLPPIRADVGMMEQVLLNLAVNSRDAMPDGGRLVIATGTSDIDAQQAAQQPAARPGKYVWLSVSDTGCGIPSEIRPRIFEPFFTTKPAGKGTGLGLATVYGIVEQHFGWLEVSSEVGRGTVFRVFLPMAAGVRVEPKIVGSAPRVAGGSETILVVEDDASLRLLVGRVLERSGYRVLRAANGSAALQMWQGHRDEVALLLTDLVMPEGVSGFDLGRRLMADRAELKIIYTSGYVARAGEGPSLVEGVNFLQKPYSTQRLLEVIRCRLDQRDCRE